MMEDVCILICIPQTSASRKLSLAAGRAIDADDAEHERALPRFCFIAQTRAAAVRTYIRYRYRWAFPMANL